MPALPPVAQLARSAALSLAVIGTALAAGRFVQTDEGGATKARIGSLSPAPRAIVPLAAAAVPDRADPAIAAAAAVAGPGLPPGAMAPVEAAPVEAAPVEAAAVPSFPVPAEPVAAALPVAADPVAADPVAADPVAAAPVPGGLAAAGPAPAVPAPAADLADLSFAGKDEPGPAPLPLADAVPADVTVAAVLSCVPSLAVLPGAGATLDLVLLAPCSPDSAVEVRHAGLTFAARTSAGGALVLSLPAMEAEGRVALRLPDGEELAAAAPVELAGVRRIAVLSPHADRLRLHAYENGAEFGAPGHVSAAAPGLAPTDLPARGGWLATLGEDLGDNPRMAEIYTLPADPAVPLHLTVEAEVTAGTCGREVAGEAVISQGGLLETAAVSFAMPGCEATGDFLVLNYPLADTRLAAAD